MDEAFSVTFRHDGARSVVTIVGELDTATAPQLDSIMRCLCAPVDGDVEIDAAQMSFCDCDGLAVLLRAAGRRRERDCRLTVTHPSAALRRLIALCEADEFLQTIDNPRPVEDDHGDMPPAD